ncbi:MAG: hypothetical protein CVV32_04035 [Methanomicrobiales archaeon HGW-Methanomicrobiales-3]|nr:MAG: hypothetical protein CVV32_04035 [Methanomicrobiales archaeon HGW-Methanomicrobiales-3]
MTADDFLIPFSEGIAMIDKKLGQQRPVFLNTAEDFVDEGNYWKRQCTEYSRMHDERAEAYIAKEQAEGRLSGSVSTFLAASLEQKSTFGVASGFYAADPYARSLYEKTKDACTEAERNYNKAMEMTSDSKYEQQAEIFHEGAEVYDVVGDRKGAAEVREAEMAAEAQAAARDEGFSDCLIVTATFGSPMASEVQLVRDFRDDTIRQDYLGSRYVTALNAIYYSFSPFVARTIDENPSVKPVMRLVLVPLLGIVLLSQGVYSLLSFSPGVATVVFIIFGGTLVGLVYILPVMLSALWVAGKKKWQIPALSCLLPFVYLWAGLLAGLIIGAVTRIDLIAVLSSGLLFVCTVLLMAGAAALFLSPYLGMIPAGKEG